MTQTEIAEKVGLSQMHISRLLSRSLESLRREIGDVTT
ncbi:sigma factor-like helix-turn-helix DNA-binding protein [Rhodococcus qingshengii]